MPTDVYNLYRGVMDAYMQGVQVRQQKELREQQFQQQQMQAQAQMQMQQERMQQQQQQFEATNQLNQAKFQQATSKFEADKIQRETENKMKVEAHRQNVLRGVEAGQYDTLEPDAQGKRVLNDPFLGAIPVPSPEDRAKVKAAAKAVELKTLAPTEQQIAVEKEQALGPVRATNAAAQAQAVDTAHQPDQITDEQRQAMIREAAATKQQVRQQQNMQLADRLTEGRSRRLIDYRKSVEGTDEVAFVNDTAERIFVGALNQEDLTRQGLPAKVRAAVNVKLNQLGGRPLATKQGETLNQVKESISVYNNLESMMNSLNKGGVNVMSTEFQERKTEAEFSLSKLARSIAEEKGNMSNQDVERMRRAIPTFTGNTPILRNIFGANSIRAIKTAIQNKLDESTKGMTGAQKLKVAETLGIDQKWLME